VAQLVEEREDARHRPHGSVETQLAEHSYTVEHTVGQLAARREQPQRHRELEAGAGLAHATRREVDRDALQREVEVRRQQRGPHSFARLPDGGVGQPDDLITGEAARHVDLDGHDLTVDARERGAANRREHCGPPET
jgi:hypothetical protein